MGDNGSQVHHAPPASVDVADSEISRGHAVLAKNTSLLSRCFLSKPLSVVHAEEVEGVLERSLGFWDLFALGFGGTIGRCVSCASCACCLFCGHRLSYTGAVCILYGSVKHRDASLVCWE